MPPVGRSALQVAEEDTEGLGCDLARERVQTEDRARRLFDVEVSGGYEKSSAYPAQLFTPRKLRALIYQI